MRELILLVIENDEYQNQQHDCDDDFCYCDYHNFVVLNFSDAKVENCQIYSKH